MKNWFKKKPKEISNKEIEKKKSEILNKKNSQITKNSKNKKSDASSNILTNYDKIMMFLTSPLWKIPISSFFYENCIYFDNEEENHFEYTKIHNVISILFIFFFYLFLQTGIQKNL